MPLKTAALGSLISQRGREHSRTNKLTKPDKKQTTTTTTTMDFCFGTFVALFLIIAAASCAPTGSNLHDACEDVKTSSLALNHVARIVSMEAQTISKYTPDIISKVDWINSTDMCDPESLKQESTRCIAKMLKVLTSYRSEVERVSRFEICSVANKVKPELSKMLDDMSRCVKHPKVIINEDTRTVERNEQPLLCRYTLDRLFSFSILTARVFALGDPALHTESSAQCTRA